MQILFGLIRFDVKKLSETPLKIVKRKDISSKFKLCQKQHP